VRGDQGQVQECVPSSSVAAICFSRRFPGGRSFAPPAARRLQLDVASLGLEPAEASRLLLEESAIAATGMNGWGDEAARYVRFVFSAEPCDRLETIPGRVAHTTLALAVGTRAE
jgi:hypothetical protein